MTINSQFVAHFCRKLENSVSAKMDKSIFESFELFKSSERYFTHLVDKFIKVFEKLQEDPEIAGLSGEVIEKFIEDYISTCSHQSAINK
jgi:hypothetical protein